MEANFVWANAFDTNRATPSLVIHPLVTFGRNSAANSTAKRAKDASKTWTKTWFGCPIIREVSLHWTAFVCKE